MQREPIPKLGEEIMNEHAPFPWFIYQEDLLDCWLNLDQPDELLEKSRLNLEERTEKHGFNGKIHVTQLVLTNRPSFFNIIKWICCLKNPNINAVTSKLKNNLHLRDFLSEE